MGAVAGARRTQSSYATFLASTNPEQRRHVGTAIPRPAHRNGEGYNPHIINQLAQLPHVTRVASAVGVDMAPSPAGRCPDLGSRELSPGLGRQRAGQRGRRGLHRGPLADLAGRPRGHQGRPVRDYERDGGGLRLARGRGHRDGDLHQRGDRGSGIRDGEAPAPARKIRDDPYGDRGPSRPRSSKTTPTSAPGSGLMTPALTRQLLCVLRQLYRDRTSSGRSEPEPDRARPPCCPGSPCTRPSRSPTATSRRSLSGRPTAPSNRLSLALGVFGDRARGRGPAHRRAVPRPSAASAGRGGRGSRRARSA